MSRTETAPCDCVISIATHGVIGAPREPNAPSSPFIDFFFWNLECFCFECLIGVITPVEALNLGS